MVGTSTGSKVTNYVIEATNMSFGCHLCRHHSAFAAATAGLFISSLASFLEHFMTTPKEALGHCKKSSSFASSLLIAHPWSSRVDFNVSYSEPFASSQKSKLSIQATSTDVGANAIVCSRRLQMTLHTPACQKRLLSMTRRCTLLTPRATGNYF